MARQYGTGDGDPSTRKHKNYSPGKKCDNDPEKDADGKPKRKQPHDGSGSRTRPGSGSEGDDLPQKVYGVKSKKKYQIYDDVDGTLTVNEKKLKTTIKLFHKADKVDRVELANSILKAADDIDLQYSITADWYLNTTKHTSELASAHTTKKKVTRKAKSTEDDSMSMEGLSFFKYASTKLWNGINTFGQKLTFIIFKRRHETSRNQRYENGRQMSGDIDQPRTRAELLKTMNNIDDILEGDIKNHTSINMIESIMASKGDFTKLDRVILSQIDDMVINLKTLVRGDKKFYEHSPVADVIDAYNILDKKVNGFKYAFKMYQKNKSYPSKIFVMMYLSLVDYLMYGVYVFADINKYFVDASVDNGRAYIERKIKQYNNYYATYGIAITDIVSFLLSVKDLERYAMSMNQTHKRSGYSQEDFDIVRQYFGDEMTDEEISNESVAVIFIVLAGLLLIIPAIRLAVYHFKCLKVDIGKYLEDEATLVTNNIESMKRDARKAEKKGDMKRVEKLNTYIRKQEIQRDKLDKHAYTLLESYQDEELSMTHEYMKDEKVIDQASQHVEDDYDDVAINF